MESIQFPGLAAHRAKHKELGGKIAEFISRHEQGDSTICAQLLQFVRDWQTRHMQAEDREYAGCSARIKFNREPGAMPAQKPCFHSPSRE